jgi:hypothetical protein
MAVENTILWVSKDPPLPIQISSLRRIYGQHASYEWADIRSATDIAREFRREQYADLVCVVPGAVLDHICRQDLRPLRPQMTTVPRGGRKFDLEIRRIRLWFDRFVRVNSFELKLQPITPEHGVRRILRITTWPQSEQEISSLQRVFGLNLEFKDDDRRLPLEIEAAVEHIIRRKQGAGAQEIILTAPHTVYQALCLPQNLYRLGGRKPLIVVFEKNCYKGVSRLDTIDEEFEEFTSPRMR